MMKRGALLGLLALIPAAAPAPVAALAAAVSGDAAGNSGTLTIRVADCSGGARMIRIPRDPRAPAPRDGDRECFKGCHAGASRKRFTCAC